jgi:hypothetical protein
MDGHPNRRIPALVGLVAASILAAGGAGSPSALAASGGRLTISPAPRTPDASPHTQISVLGVGAERIRSVSARGAATGAHAGRLRPYSRDRGASFVPDRPFAEGERVDVVVRVEDRKPVRFWFKVAHLAPNPPVINFTQTQPSKLQHFVSRPNLIPPQLTVLNPAGATRGRVFLTPLPSPIVHPQDNNAITINPVGPGGPMISNPNGRLVWFKQLKPPEVAANLRIQRFRDQRVLTWWQGNVTLAAFGLGEGVIANHSYRTIQTVDAGNGYDMDIHEFTLTPGGDALFTIYSPLRVHLPGTPAGTTSPLLDSIVQEVDIRTGLVVWEWHCYGHIPLEDSYATPQNSSSYDAYHLNSIQPLPDGRVLVSARDTSAVYEIDRASGRILWTLGGKASSFRLAPASRFHFQHDAQMLPHDRVSLFDDEGGPPTTGPARGLVLALNPRRHTARLVRQYRRSADTFSQSEGSVQTRPSEDAFVGFGAAPFFSEFSPGGRLLYDASLPQDDGSYRAYRFGWKATPNTRPRIAARSTDPSTVSVYATWNGATNVARWEVLAGQSAQSLRSVASKRKHGFETRIDVPSSARTFAVRALSSRGRVLAVSRPVHPS